MVIEETVCKISLDYSFFILVKARKYNNWKFKILV